MDAHVLGRRGFAQRGDERRAVDVVDEHRPRAVAAQRHAVREAGNREPGQPRHVRRRQTPSNTRAPVMRACSRSAKRSVMPAM